MFLDLMYRVITAHFDILSAEAFDWKYKQAIELAERDASVKASLCPQDGLPGISALWCRKYFGILPLK